MNNTHLTAFVLALAVSIHDQSPATLTKGAAQRMIPSRTKVAEIAKRDHGRTGVSFRTSDAGLQKLFDAAETKAAKNVVQINPAMKVLIEGAGVDAAYLYTAS